MKMRLVAICQRRSEFKKLKLTKLRILLLLIGLPQLLLSQVTVTTESFTEKRWILNSNITLPATKFFLASNTAPAAADDPKGYLELFSSFGVGFSMNYGKATFKKNVETQELLDNETTFANLIGLQVGVLYSSKLNEVDQNSVNEFSIYSGVNILDLHIGTGYELGAKPANTSRWFVSVAYGIPLYKLTGKASHIFEKRRKQKLPQRRYQNDLEVVTTSR